MMRLSQIEAIENRLNQLDRLIDKRTDHCRPADDLHDRILGMLDVIRLAGHSVDYINGEYKIS